MNSTFIVLGAVLAALAVALGAFGAHGLKSLVEQGRYSAKDLDTFNTAVQYQMVHALGLVLIGLLRTVRSNVVLDLAGWIMFAGILLFSGFLYAYVASGIRLFALLVPIGGVAFILAWLAVAVGAVAR